MKKTTIEGPIAPAYITIGVKCVISRLVKERPDSALVTLFLLARSPSMPALAVPMADAFDFTQSQFQRILSNYLGLDGAISIPHTHHCGGGVTSVLTQGTVNHLQVCPVLGRNSAPLNAVRDVVSHLVVQNGVTNAAVVETRLTAETEAPSMRTLSTSIHPPGRGLSWKSQSSQSDLIHHWVGVHELD